MKRSFDSRVDYSLLLPVFCLLVIGVVAIYIAVSHDYPNNVLPILGQQIAWIALGLVIGFVVMFFNTEFLWKVTPYLYGLGLALMVLPLVFYNPSLVASTGAKNWVSIGGTTLFQPSEFMKISYILVLARVIVQFTQKHKEWRRTIPLDFLGPCHWFCGHVLQYRVFMEGDSLSLWFRPSLDGPPSCFLQSKSCSINRCQELGIDWWNDTLSAIGVHEDFLHLDISSSHCAIHSKTQGMATDYSVGFSIDWLDDCLYHPSLDPLSPTK